MAVETSERPTIDVLEKATGEPIRSVGVATVQDVDDDLIVRETGSIPGKAQYEVGGAANELHEAAGLTSRAVGEILPSHSPGRFSIAERVPVGVVGAITPHVPFGGLGASGLGGRSGGDSNLEEFTERRWVSLQREPVEYPY